MAIVAIVGTSAYYSALKTELTTDPMALGYGSFITAGADNRCAFLINSAVNTANIPVSFVQAPFVFEAIVPSEWAMVSVTDKQLIQTILGMGNVYMTGTHTRAAFQQAFLTGTQTRTNLIALFARTGSRAEGLFGEGTIVNDSDVSKALRG